MSLLAEVDAAGDAVEGPDAFVYPLVHVPVAGRREDLQINKIARYRNLPKWQSQRVHWSVPVSPVRRMDCLFTTLYIVRKGKDPSINLYEFLRNLSSEIFLVAIFVESVIENSLLPFRRPGRDTGAAWASGDTFCGTQSVSRGRMFWSRVDRKWGAGCTRPPRAHRPPSRSSACRTADTHPSGTHLTTAKTIDFSYQKQLIN